MFYDDHAFELADRYERLRFEDVHRSLIDLLPERPGNVLDVGAGSGRDAAWLSGKGHDVVAVEPSAAMRAQAIGRHPDLAARWVGDSLPALGEVHRLGLTFDFILLSGIWMHVRPTDRQRAFRKLVTLLRPSGRIAISLRLGPADPEREMFPVSQEELERLAREFGLIVLRVAPAADLLGRPEVRWITVVMALPDDGTGALPLLRHIILKDDKASTYKLALLRVLARIADAATGLARIEDEFVVVPLGLVALYWIRQFKPLVEEDYPQSPSHQSSRGLGFVSDHFHRLRPLAHQDLRIGMRFTDEIGAALHGALRDAADTVRRMPAHYITWPGQDRPVFPVTRSRLGLRPDPLVIDAPLLWSFGEFRVPENLWRALSRFTVWIEPVLVAEWARLVELYARNQGRSLPAARVAEKLVWLDPVRDTAYVRDIALRMMTSDQPLHCIWSGARLRQDILDIDHCFPFAAWPCNDLWNLVPASRRINQHAKSARLVSAQTLAQARERISEWWERAYIVGQDGLNRDRFFGEALAALPLRSVSAPQTDDVLDCLELRRALLRQDQQLEEWMIS